MHLVYKIFLGVFIILAGINIYAIDYNKGLMHEDNSKFLFSCGAAILGIVGVFILNMWSKLRTAK